MIAAEEQLRFVDRDERGPNGEKSGDGGLACGGDGRVHRR
jgi:hypothetical protein